jgi:hypothetical protein
MVVGGVDGGGRGCWRCGECEGEGTAGQTNGTDFPFLSRVENSDFHPTSLGEDGKNWIPYL